MYIFKDFWNNNVFLTIDNHPKWGTPKHVWILTHYQGQWVLTSHKKRGLEFPGGKVEQRESLEEAARREVREEIGAETGDLHFVGQYKVEGDEIIVKAIFCTEVTRWMNQEHYFETNGPHLVSGDLLSERNKEEYSFIMKDDVLVHTLEQIKSYIEQKGLKK